LTTAAAQMESLNSLYKIQLQSFKKCSNQWRSCWK
jgi:hypothetical protein